MKIVGVRTLYRSDGLPITQPTESDESIQWINTAVVSRTVRNVLAVVRQNAACMAGAAMEREYQRCVRLAEVPPNSTSPQHCQFVYLIVTAFCCLSDYI